MLLDLIVEDCYNKSINCRSGLCSKTEDRDREKISIALAIRSFDLLQKIRSELRY